MKELLSATSVLLVVGTADSPNTDHWLLLSALLLVVNLVVWNFEAIDRWQMARAVAPVIMRRPREVSEVIRHYARASEYDFDRSAWEGQGPLEEPDEEDAAEQAAFDHRQTESRAIKEGLR